MVDINEALTNCFMSWADYITTAFSPPFLSGDAPFWRIAYRTNAFYQVESTPAMASRRGVYTLQIAPRWALKVLTWLRPPGGVDLAKKSYRTYPKALRKLLVRGSRRFSETTAMRSWWGYISVVIFDRYVTVIKAVWTLDVATTSREGIERRTRLGRFAI